MINKGVREQGVSIGTLWRLFIKNIFSTFYFAIVGIILAVVYTQFLVKPVYTASGNIENIGAVSNLLMQTISTTAKEPETLDSVVDKMLVAEDQKNTKVAEIRSKLVVSNYNATTLKINIAYTGSSQSETTDIVNYVIDVSIERFIERNPSLDGKIQKQSAPIVANSAGLSNTIIFAGFAVLGAGFGIVIGIGGDLVNRRILFTSDVEEYNLPYNIIDLSRTKKDKMPILESEKFKSGTLFLQDKLEGAARRSKAKVIGVANLGYETYNGLSGIFAENLNLIGLKTLIIDLDLEHPSIHTLYNLDKRVNITKILTEENVEPVRVKENLYVLPAEEYAYPARFLKDERLNKLIRKYDKEFDYIFINVPVTDYYASLLFNFNLVDMLLINTSFEGTKKAAIDKYILNIEQEHRDKLFLNAIDSQVKRSPFKLKPKKTN